MNIKITYDWLLEYLDTDATPADLQKYLSLCGPSVERVTKVGDDYVLEIEITSNRIDMASVFGIAQEAQAILPQFGKRAKLKQNPLKELQFKNLNSKTGKDLLQIEIKRLNLCSRFSAIVLSNVKVEKSPDFISKRLELCGIKSINNVVDISNYLMLSLGQPTHIFDYDQVKKSLMILRESNKGEKIITLDDKQLALPGGDIVIEDGGGRLIDLCGIMGGLNSAVTSKTKSIVLFVQTYNKQKIRHTSMTTGQRSMASTYFEKGIDEERVEPTLVYGLTLLSEYADALPSSPLYDIYPKPYSPKKISVAVDNIAHSLGVTISDNQIKQILNNLGFSVSGDKILQITVPSFRKYDIEIKEDIIEEVARIYGYHNLPDRIAPFAYVPIPKDIENLFSLQQKVRTFFKNHGFHEVVNYSMISKDQIENFGFETKDHLQISNPISEELKYLRTSLFPSLIKNIKDNEGKRDQLNFFEIAKIYLPQAKDLPQEIYKLSIATNTNFFQLKGIIETLFNELNIVDYKIQKGNILIFVPGIQANILQKNSLVGSFGQLKLDAQHKFGLKKPLFLAGIRFHFLAENYRVVAPYKQITPYAVIKLDLTAKIPNFDQFKQEAFKTSVLLKEIELLDKYKENVTLRFFFSSNTRNITEEEAKNELAKIEKLLK